MNHNLTKDFALPDVEAIRQRINTLNEEVNLLRRLLRAVVRIQDHQTPHTQQTRREAVNAAR